MGDPKFKLKNVTAATWQNLSNPPDGSAPPVEPSALCLSDVDTCMKQTADRVDDKPEYARNTDWNPRPLPKITTPISWPFLQQPITKKSADGKRDILNLAFVAAPRAGYTVRIYHVTYTRVVDAPPQVIAVAFPTDIDIEAAPRFLVHFKHYPGQAFGTSLFQYFNPMGYDWLAWELWRRMTYNARREPDGSDLVDMPFVSEKQTSYGFCYQLRQANKPYVLVLPLVSRVFDAAAGRLRDYQLYSAAMLRNILIAIQRDLLSITDETLAHVAISVNSTGCNIFSQFLTDNVAAAKKDQAVATFMSDELNEVFVFDPPEDFSNGMITSIERWRTLSSSRSGSKGKCVRFYTHTFATNFATLAGGTNPFTKGKAGLWESSAKTLSLAYLPYDYYGNDIWQHTCKEILPSNTPTVSNFSFVHQVIPALCLTDAASRSLYV